MQAFLLPLHVSGSPSHLTFQVTQSNILEVTLDWGFRNLFCSLLNKIWRLSLDSLQPRGTMTEDGHIIAENNV